MAHPVSTDTLINEDLEARQSRWGSLISELEDEWDFDDDNGNEDRSTSVAPGIISVNGLDGLRMAPASSIGAAVGREVTPPAAFPFQSSQSSDTKSFPFQQWSSGSGGGSHSGIGGGAACLNAADTSPTLHDWIASHRGNWDSSKPMKLEERRKYLEKSVHILHSLVGKIIGGYNSDSGNNNDEIYIHPNFINIKNILVREMTLVGGEELSADFVECGDSIFYNNEDDEDNNRRKKYLAMDALGRMAYEMFMLGGGPSVFKFRSKSRGSGTMNILSNALSIHDRETTSPGDDHAANKADDIDEEDEIINMLRKNPRTTTSEETDNSGIMSTMLDANVPFPLCRFVSDLLDDDDDDHEMLFGRSERSFYSLSDVLSDLKQMVDNPDAFLHASSPDRWKLVFGEKLYGREEATKEFMDAAERVATIRDDPIFNGLSGLVGKRKEVIMVSGHSGAGKSRLVRLGGKLLEERGWIFLRCKFDRVVHPEPLSILAYAFDEYFLSSTSCPVHGMKNTRDTYDHLSPHSSSDSECNCSRSQVIGERLEGMMSPEGLGILAKHIPSLRLVVNVPALSDTIEVNEAIMHTLFGTLLQVLSSKRTPIIFFIDDLQWVDPLSLALLMELVKGARPFLPLSSTAEAESNCKQNRNQVSEEDINVMFVGSYRDNEVDDDHLLAKVLRKFQSDSSINMTNISLSGFTIETLNTMLSESLRMPVRRVRSLSEMIIQKTDGRPLHVIEFIQALTMDNLLMHSFARGWEWDADSIDICQITDSVAELFAFKLRRLPQDILVGLQILSCFGSQIDQHVLSFVADYDGEDSVDITAAIHVAVSEGLVERAAHLVSFTHDMIQKATNDSISDDALVSLLRKLVTALIKNASAVNELDSVLFVVVDLINRIGSSHDATSSPKERALFAELNSRAGSKAITVPDFAGAAKYAENGIAFLSDSRWETQYDLSIRLYETAVLSHFSSLEGNRDHLMKRINAVFEHAKDFSDQFKIRCVWIKVLSMTDLSRAIEESLNALERLGEPLNLDNIDSNIVRGELMKRKEQFSGERKKKFLSSNRLSDCNKVRAMKIMSCLIVYYHMQKSFLGSYISCQMIDMSMDYGHCEDSVFGAAAFATALVTVLGDIDEGSTWGRTTLSLMKMYDKEILIPSIHGTLYGMVFFWKEPIQSTLEPLAQGIRVSFATGNVDFAMVNTVYYIARSFNCGKNISVLTGEVEVLARQHGNHFGNDASSDTPVYSPLLQFYLTPLYNALRDLERGDTKDPPPEGEDASFPLNKVRLVNNDDVLKLTLKTGQLACFHTILSYETAKAFIFRDMDNALKFTDMYLEQFWTKDLHLLYTAIYNIFYEALINFHFMRQTGEERYRLRGENALMQMKEWSTHSDWNFKNKLLLVEAELHYTQKDFDKAAICYEASVKAAREHKFIHEEAIASELAGIFFSEIGLRQKAKSFYLHSIECFKKWGAFAVARRVETSIQSKFGSGLMLLEPIVDSCLSSAFASKEGSLKKRQSPD